MQSIAGFWGFSFGVQTPHFSTFSKNYERRFKETEVFENIFLNIVKQAIDYGLVGGEILYTDSTHKKANANKTTAIDTRWLEDYNEASTIPG